eukprot:14055685-Heterocapsa_arctica.AAC.1
MKWLHNFFGSLWGPFFGVPDCQVQRVAVLHHVGAERAVVLELPALEEQALIPPREARLVVEHGLYHVRREPGVDVEVD